MKRYSVFLFFLLGILAACNHNTDEFDGPNLIDRFGEFRMNEDLAVSQASVDFSAGETVFFTAQFSKRIDWLIRITGKESGAVKIIEGFSNVLDASNATWNGSVTALPLMRAEDCMAELIIPEEDSLTFSVDLSVTGTRSYEGELITDFESDPGTDIFIGNFEFDFSARTGIQEDIIAAEGQKYFLLEGTNKVLVQNAFVGLIRIFPSINGDTYFPVPTTIPEQLYFNFFLWEDGTPGTIAVFQFFTDTNDDGKFTDNVDESFQIQGDVAVEDGGWRHVFRTMDQTGMTEDQLSKIVAVQVLLISIAGPETETRFGLDYLTFTRDKELQL